MHREGLTVSDLLIDSAIAAEAAESGSADSIVAASSSQRWMWVLDQLHPGNPVHVGFSVFRLRGSLDVGALRRALEVLVGRHDALRATFTMAAGTLMQQIRPQVACELGIVDVTAATWREAMDFELRRPFDLSRGPVFRFSLLRIDATDHVLVLTFHHIITDRTSIRLFLSELGALYRAKGLARPALRYVDALALQQAQLEGERLERLLGFWKAELAGELPILELPLDAPRPVTRMLEAQSYAHGLDPKLVRRLRAIGASEGASLFKTTLAVLALLLHRYTGQAEILIGTPFGGRRTAGFESVFGCFISTLPIRVRFDRGLSFRALVRQVRDTVDRAIDHQELPLEALVRELDVVRTPSVPPLYQVIFQRDNTENETLDLGEVRCEPIVPERSALHVDLHWWITGEGDDLTNRVYYDKAILGAETVGRLIECYGTLLNGLVADADADVATVPLLDETERERMLVAWNDTDAPYDGDRCVHQRFESIADEFASKLAVSCGADALTYAQLNRRSNALARRLRDLGVGRGTLVAIAVERSLDMIVGIVAILKAGGAYVPLDVSFPDERLHYMIADTASPVLLTQSHLSSRFADVAAEIVLLDRLPTAGSFEAEANLDNVTDPEQPAMVLYTSARPVARKGPCCRIEPRCAPS